MIKGQPKENKQKSCMPLPVMVHETGSTLICSFLYLMNWNGEDDSNPVSHVSVAEPPSALDL